MLVYHHIQYVFDEQQANFDHFNELKPFILTSFPGFKIFTRSKKRGCVNSRGASIQINTVFM